MKIPLPAKLRNESEETLARTYGNTGQREETSSSSTARTPANKELPIYINFIDEDGEVLQLQTKPSELTSQVFDRYALQQGTPFLISRMMYNYGYSGKRVPSNVTIKSIGIDNNAIVYVKATLPSRTDFNKLVPNILAFVKNYPRCFINQQLSDGSITGNCTIKDYIGYTDTFIIKGATDGQIIKFNTDQLIKILTGYYSNLNGFHQDIDKYFGQLVSNYEYQVKHLDTNQSLDKPNAIVLRIIKIRQQLYRLLEFIGPVINDVDDETFELIFSDTFDRLSDLQSSLAAKEKITSNTSLHKMNKPLLQSEDIVRVKQWPSNDNKTLEPSWEKGTIISCRSYTEHEDIDGYGPRRVYNVEFDNGDIQTDIEDYRLILEEEYLLSKRVKESDWKGVKRIFDEESSDPWAREVGWYVATCTCIENGVKHDDEQHYVYLSDALRVYDMRTIFLGEVKEPESDLNFPDLLKNYNELSASERIVQICMLQVKDRLSDPIMRRICRILIELIHPGKIEHNGAHWNMALGHYTDGNTNQMRDSVYKFALSKECKVLGSVSIVCASYCGFSNLNISYES